ncbi:uncharacterized protein Z520_11070 [Fonsecaea multimorphosa CBS 102226]|uniref:Uncharacterized protein n=1 Tax=Fonsecaea multimorphosa CBS 102226 TaxID=1442371 RepID=A0A0D2I7N7_9EURO|nr:uncharacterized protein Z520_11070 [Fonsecaea multimorphosa CBS 102226]KIX93216.1 hypothetical protein Z520_11070 [Fonsecaea multimorphosa CBS 102226]OAL18452.1 hypothetical protein AYO22_10648 [Fonsecaea multimorphosa]
MLGSVVLVSLAAVAVTGAVDNNGTGRVLLTERQTTTPCFISTTPVTACGPGDLTTANWDAFGIDNFLAGTINQFGASDNFPKFFVSQNTPTANPFDDFDCSAFGSTTCTVPTLNNPDAATDCIFDGLQGTFCANFVSPEAGFVVQNYINLWQGLQNHHDAIQDAADAITSANFINTMVSALAPQKQPIGPAILSRLVDLVTDILPIGGEIKAATTFIKKIRLIIKATKSDLEDDSKDIVSIEQNNAAIDQEVSATEDQLTQQLANIVSGTQSRLQNILNQIFGADQDPQLITDPSTIGTTFAFLNAYHGVFLDDVPQRSDLAAQMQKQLQNWIVSAVLSTMGYDVTIDTTPLEDPPGQPGTVCHAENGFPVAAGCALFRINGIDHSNGDVIDSAQQGNNIFALQDTAGMDIGGIIANAQACNGGSGGSTADFEDFLDMDNTDALPSCMFNFRVVVTAL